MLLKTQGPLTKRRAALKPPNLIHLFICLFYYFFIYLLMNAYTGYNFAVKYTIYFIYNKIH